MRLLRLLTVKDGIVEFLKIRKNDPDTEIMGKWIPDQIFNSQTHLSEV